MFVCVVCVGVGVNGCVCECVKVVYSGDVVIYPRITTHILPVILMMQ